MTSDTHINPEPQTDTNNIFLAGQVILIDKPYEWTSFDVVNKIKRLLKNKYRLKKIKVGHAGTLDPLATGLMIICTGKATRQIPVFQNGKKEYNATIRLGATTPCYDLEKEIDRLYPVDHITPELIEQARTKFIGKILQRPPIFSAKKVDGKRAYKKARSGEQWEFKPVEVEIMELETLEVALPYIKFRIVCSKGTYIRAFARDIGEALNSGAHLTALQRTLIGDYKLPDAISLEKFSENLKKM